MQQLSSPLPPCMPTQIAMIAGEASGDLIASLLVKGLLANAAEPLHLFGVGGPAMQAAGFDMQVSIEQLAVRGYVEVLRHLPRLLLLRRRLGAQWLQNKPAAFIGVDAPDFNLGLELKLRAQGVKTIHLVCPSIWAWRRERVEKIRQSVSHMLCIFPFEQALLEKEGIPATYVGHPIADMIPQRADVGSARAALGLRETAPVVALLPGSRRDEIKYIAPRFLEAAALIKRAEPETQFVLPAAGEARRAQLQPLLVRHANLGIKLTDGQSHTCLAASDAVLVASGTATLEAALFKKPMVIAYAMPAASYWMMKDKGYLPYVGLPNILCEEFVVPELLQHRATPAALADAVLHQLRDTGNRTRLEQRFTALHASLQRDFANTAARTVLGLL